MNKKLTSVYKSAAILFPLIFIIILTAISVFARSDAESMVLASYTYGSTTDVSVGVHMNENTLNRIEYNNTPINAANYVVGTPDGNGITQITFDADYLVTFAADRTYTLTVYYNSYTEMYSSTEITKWSLPTEIFMTVGKTEPSLSLTAAPIDGSGIYGDNVTLTAMVFASGNGALPTGTVTFKQDGVIIAADVAIVGDKAEFTVSGLNWGTDYSFTAEYAGDTNYSAVADSITGYNLIKPEDPKPEDPKPESSSSPSTPTVFYEIPMIVNPRQKEAAATSAEESSPVIVMIKKLIDTVDMVRELSDSLLRFSIA
jgi:hypothetical protein